MSYGLFTGALVMHYEAEKVGCLVVPAGPGNSERQLLLMRDFHVTVCHATPSYALYFAGFLERKGVDPRRDLSLRKLFVGAEPYTEETRRRIEHGLSAEVYNSYGLSEMNGPGVAFECEHKCGMQLWEDNFLIRLEKLDEMTVQVELAETAFDGQVEHAAQLRDWLAEKLKAELLIRPQVDLAPPGSLPVSEGKATRVIDNRRL